MNRLYILAIHAHSIVAQGETFGELSTKLQGLMGDASLALAALGVAFATFAATVAILRVIADCIFAPVTAGAYWSAIKGPMLGAVALGIVSAALAWAAGLGDQLAVAIAE